MLAPIIIIISPENKSFVGYVVLLLPPIYTSLRLSYDGDQVALERSEQTNIIRLSQCSFNVSEPVLIAISSSTKWKCHEVSWNRKVELPMKPLLLVFWHMSWSTYNIKTALLSLTYFFYHNIFFVNILSNRSKFLVYKLDSERRVRNLGLRPVLSLDRYHNWINYNSSSSSCFGQKHSN